MCEEDDDVSASNKLPLLDSGEFLHSKRYHTLCLCVCVCVCLSLSNTHTHTHAQSLLRPLSFPLTHTHSLCLFLTHTHTHTLSLSVPVSLQCRPVEKVLPRCRAEKRLCPLRKRAKRVLDGDHLHPGCEPALCASISVPATTTEARCRLRFLLEVFDAAGEVVQHLLRPQIAQALMRGGGRRGRRGKGREEEKVGRGVLVMGQSNDKAISPEQLGHTYTHTHTFSLSHIHTRSLSLSLPKPLSPQTSLSPNLSLQNIPQSLTPATRQTPP